MTSSWSSEEERTTETPQSRTFRSRGKKNEVSNYLSRRRDMLIFECIHMCLLLPPVDLCRRERRAEWSWSVRSPSLNDKERQKDGVNTPSTRKPEKRKREAAERRGKKTTAEERKKETKEERKHRERVFLRRISRSMKGRDKTRKGKKTSEGSTCLSLCNCPSPLLFSSIYLPSLSPSACLSPYGGKMKGKEIDASERKKRRRWSSTEEKRKKEKGPVLVLRRLFTPLPSCWSVWEKIFPAFLSTAKEAKGKTESQRLWQSKREKRKKVLQKEKKEKVGKTPFLLSKQTSTCADMSELRERWGKTKAGFLKTQWEISLLRIYLLRGDWGRKDRETEKEERKKMNERRDDVKRTTREIA